MPGKSGRKKFRLASDNDCHWYVIPDDMSGEWSRFCELQSDDEESWDVPEWAVRVGGSPAEVTFDGFAVWGKAYP